MFRRRPLTLALLFASVIPISLAHAQPPAHNVTGSRLRQARSDLGPSWSQVWTQRQRQPRVRERNRIHKQRARVLRGHQHGHPTRAHLKQRSARERDWTTTRDPAGRAVKKTRTVDDPLQRSKASSPELQPPSSPELEPLDG